MKKGIIAEFNLTGICILNLKKLVKLWDDRYCITQYGKEYRLVYQPKLNKEEFCKVTISEEQALQIIEMSQLIPIKSSMFKTATTWRSISNVTAEKQRLEKLVKEKRFELGILTETVEEYQRALLKSEWKTN